MQLDTIKERLAKLLRDKLIGSQDAEDMFRVFARINPLLKTLITSPLSRLC
jgi:dynein heavy chain 1, cytosolic